MTKPKATKATQLSVLQDALTDIASYSDVLANKYLETTGSYNCFDEPGSVQVAREALAKAAKLAEKPK